MTHQPSYTIEFDVPIDVSDIVVHLQADVVIAPYSYYTVSNFRTNKQESVLPPLVIKQKNGEWVHFDTEQPTILSRAVGKAIEKLPIDVAN